MTTLMTGGAGFLGSHLCARLLDDGHDVVSVDNYFTSSRRNLAHLLNTLASRPSATMSAFRSMSRWTGSTISPARPRRSTTSTIRSRPRRRACTARSTCSASPSACMPASCRPRRPRSMAIRSSIRRPRAIGAHVNPIGPRACYDEGKRCAETLFFDYHRQHRLEIKVARIFNTYGPRMHPNDGRVVSNFIVQALTTGADHDLRRRHADAQLLLRRRSDPRRWSLHGERRRSHRAGESRQSGRIDDARARRACPAADRQPLEDRLRAAALRTIPSSAAPTSRSPSSISVGRHKLRLKTD